MHAKSTGFAHPGTGLTHYLSTGFALMGEVLFFASPKKSTQKKGEPDGLPATRVTCASRNFERSPNSQHLPRLRLANPARQGGSLALKIPAMLGGANGTGGAVFLAPLVPPSTAGKTGASAPPVRVRSERSEIGELGARRFFRGAQGTPRHTTGVPWGQPPDRFSFGSFSLAEQRK
jgi:hypothetical protein